MSTINAGNGKKGLMGGSGDTPIDPLAFAGEYHRRKARKAAVTRQQWKETQCEFYMTFVEFRQQGVRNRILRSYGREPIYLPGEGKPTFH